MLNSNNNTQKVEKKFIYAEASSSLNYKTGTLKGPLQKSFVINTLQLNSSSLNRKDLIFTEIFLCFYYQLDLVHWRYISQKCIRKR